MTTTAEELFAMGDIGRCELIRGEIIMMPLSGAEHGDIAMQIGARIHRFVSEKGLGKAYATGTGFILSRRPDTVRAPDAAFVRADRVPKIPVHKYFPGAPDLAVEVVSPSDTHRELVAKVDEWLAAGTTSVWVVDPPNQRIDVYRKGIRVLRFRMGDMLRGEPMLPEFELKIADVFN